MDTFTRNDLRGLGRAICAAAFDKRLELGGQTVVIFFDADVIAGALYAADQIERDWGRHQNQQQHERWAIVRSLWARGAVCPVRLTMPHLRELRWLLDRIRAAGGRGASRQQQVESFLQRIGVGGSIRSVHDVLASAPHVSESAATLARWMMDNLPPFAFAVLDAEAALGHLRQPGSIEALVDLRSEAGEDQRDIIGDPRVVPLLDALQRARSEASPAAQTVDAVAIVAMGRLMQRWRREGAPLHLRFYTQSMHLRRLCVRHPDARDLLSGDPPSASWGIDEPGSVLRASRYMILRSTVRQLAFAHRAEHAPSIDTSLGLEDLDELGRVVTRIGAADDAPSHLDSLLAAVAKEFPVARNAPEVLRDLLDGSFCYRVWLRQGLDVLSSMPRVQDGPWARVARVLGERTGDLDKEFLLVLDNLEQSLSAMALRHRLTDVVRNARAAFGGEHSWRSRMAPGADSGLVRWLLPGETADAPAEISVCECLLRSMLSDDLESSARAIADCAAALAAPDGASDRLMPTVVALQMLGGSGCVADLLTKAVSRTPKSRRIRWLLIWAQSELALSAADRLTVGSLREVASLLQRLSDQWKGAAQRQAAITNDGRDAAEVLPALWGVFHLCRASRASPPAGGHRRDLTDLIEISLSFNYQADFAAWNSATQFAMGAVELLLRAECALLDGRHNRHQERVMYLDALFRDAPSYYVVDALRWARMVVMDRRVLASLPRLDSGALASWAATHMPPPFLIEEYQIEHLRHFLAWSGTLA